MNSEPLAAEKWDRIIRPRHGLVRVDFAEMWRYRELLIFLTWRSVLIRYKQTAFGVLWAVMQPLLTVLVFTVIFGRMARLPSHGAPYAVMTLAAVLPWQFFASALSQGSNSIVGAQAMVEKIYFPRLFIPLSEILSSAVDFAISLLILAGLMVWFNVPARLPLLLLPVFSVMALLASLGISLFFSALNVKYRDVKHVMPFLVRLGMYVSPVGFMSSVVSERWRLIFSLNPIVGVIDGFRWAVLGDEFALYWPGFLAGLAVSAVLLAAGVLFFRSTEKTFADLI